MTQLIGGPASLRHLGYSTNTAFLCTETATVKLTAPLDLIESLLVNPPFHVAVQSGLLRQKVDSFPALDLRGKSLSTPEIRRAFKILAFTAQAYVSGGTGSDRQLPNQIAGPLNELSDHLGTEPWANYAAAVLWNCSLRDESQEWRPENVLVDITFTASLEEESLYAVSACIESTGSEAINSLTMAAAFIINESSQHRAADSWLIRSMLSRARECIDGLVIHLAALLRFDSNAFRNVRPYLAGWSLLGPNQFPSAGRPCSNSSAIEISTAQPTLFQGLDVLLDVEYDPSENQGSSRARTCVPAAHRAIIDKLEAYRGVLTEYAGMDEDIAEALKSVAKEVLRFRVTHLTVASKFRTREATSHQHVEAELGPTEVDTVRSALRSPLIHHIVATRRLNILNNSYPAAAEP